MAIKNSLGNIIGVIQLVNKFDNLVSAAFSNQLNGFVLTIHNLIDSRILPETMKILWKRSRSSAAWEFTIQTCTKKQLLQWPNKVLH